MKVLLGITGGIAAYKCLDVIRLLMKQGAEVRVILTANGARFVTPLTVAALSGNPVGLDMFAGRTEPAPQHIELGLWPDVFAVAPATANFLAKAAAGIADDLLSTTYLALKPGLPVVLAPAMNTRMWNHPAVQRNLAMIATDLGPRCRLVGPCRKLLACGEEGIGALAEPDEIATAILASVRP
jgi:phosphopantothenoylcysteine decarboxylase/phosphopantothenate--cysteine ligase